MTMSSLPDAPTLFRLRTMTHIGTLDPAHKGERGESLEGAGLSVSRHPEAWEAIARLGGAPWWEADARALKLLHGHLLVTRHAEALRQWGLEQGLVEPATAYVVSWMDGETEEPCSFWMTTREEAEAEARFRDEEGDESRVEERPTVAPTAKLLAFMAHDPKRAGQVTPTVLDDLATAWAHARGLDGVWWADRLDPQALSAPRGVVFPEQVHRLTWTKTRDPAQPRPACPA